MTRARFAFSKRGNEYLTRGRLEDLLVLIQVLGLDQRLQIYDATLMKELGPPDSASSWVEVAKSHREYFRVSGQNADAISLVARLVAKDQTGQRNLSEEFVNRLIETVIKMHDHYLGRRDRILGLYIPILTALIGAMVTFVARTN